MKLGRRNDIEGGTDEAGQDERFVYCEDKKRCFCTTKYKPDQNICRFLLIGRYETINSVGIPIVMLFPLFLLSSEWRKTTYRHDDGEEWAMPEEREMNCCTAETTITGDHSK